jgi:hypothetical protein
MRQDRLAPALGMCGGAAGISSTSPAQDGLEEAVDAGYPLAAVV